MAKGHRRKWAVHSSNKQKKGHDFSDNPIEFALSAFIPIIIAIVKISTYCIEYDRPFENVVVFLCLLNKYHPIAPIIKLRNNISKTLRREEPSDICSVPTCASVSSIIKKFCNK